MIWDFKGTIVGLGDTHHCWSHRPSINKAIDIIEQLRPDYVIQVGDLKDFFAQSRFPKVLEMTPKEEKERSRHDADLMWSLIKKASPNSSLHQLLGNHCIRGMKLAVANTPELVPFLNFDSYFDYSEWGVETIWDPREVLEIEGICFTHGHRTKLGDHLKDFDFKPVVCGHSHRGGVHFQRLANNKITFELNCGYLADPFSQALTYRALNKFFQWTHGIGLIDHFGPRFIPFGDL